MATPGTNPSAIRTPADLVEQLGVLRRARARGTGKAKVSLDDLASGAGIPRSTVHSYLSGRVIPPADALDAILIAMGVGGSELGAWADALERVRAGKSAAPAQQVAEAPVSPDTARQPSARSLLATPHQLPPVPRLVGRAAELAQLDQLWGARHGAGIIGVVGPGGVGKTALTVDWAKRHLDDFPDGQLYIDLQGFGADSGIDALRVLYRLLPAVGVPRPDGDLTALQADFRRALTGRRMVLVFDNARDAAHVRPLQPGGDSVLVLVTSRDDLRGLEVLDGASILTLGPLSAVAADELVASLSGERPRPWAAAIQQCGGLPLALRLFSTTVRGRSPGGLGEDGTTRLDALALVEGGRDLGVRGVLRGSLAALGDDAARLVCRLGAVPGPWLPDELIEAAFPGSAAGLAELASGHLLQRDQANRGWHRHDLATDYLYELATERPADYLADLREVLLWAVGETLILPVHPEPLLVGRLHGKSFQHHPIEAREALLDRHQDLLLALARRALDTGQLDDAAVIVATLCDGAFQVRTLRSVAGVVPEFASAAAASGNDELICLSHNLSSLVAGDAGDEELACEYLTRALQTEVGRRPGSVRQRLLTSRGYSLVLRGLYAESERDLLEAIDLAEADSAALAWAETNYGLSLMEQQRREEALAVFLRVIGHSRAPEPTPVPVLPLVNALFVALELGRTALVLELRAELDGVAERVESRNNLIPICHVRAAVAAYLGDTAEAVRHAQQGVEVAQDTGDTYLKIVASLNLADAYLEDGQTGLARGMAAFVVQDAERAGYPLIAADAWGTILGSDMRDGDLARVRGDRDQALADAERIGFSEHFARTEMRAIRFAKPPQPPPDL